MPSTNFITKTVTLRKGETRESALKILNQRFQRKTTINPGSGDVTIIQRKPNFAKFTFVRERDDRFVQLDRATVGTPRIPIRRPKRISSPKRKSTRVTPTLTPLEERKKIFENAQRKILRDDIKLRAREMALRKRGTRDSIEDANALKRRRLNLLKFLQREKRDIRLASKRDQRPKQMSIFDPDTFATSDDQFVTTTVVDPSTTRLQRRELIRQGKPVPTIEVNLPRREKPKTRGIPEFALRPFENRGFGNFFPSRSPAKALGSVTLGDPTVSRKRRSKIKGKKGKKKKRSKPKPLKSIFDLSF